MKKIVVVLVILALAFSLTGSFFLEPRYSWLKDIDGIAGIVAVIVFAVREVPLVYLLMIGVLGCGPLGVQFFLALRKQSAALQAVDGIKAQLSGLPPPNFDERGE